MADDDDKSDKTEEATPKRREDAREEGQVALSQEILAATSLVGSFGVLVIGGGLLARNCGALVERSLGKMGELGREEFSAADWSAIIGGSARSMALPVLTLVVPLLAIVALAAYAQVGIQISPKAISWNPSRLDPVAGSKRLFSLRSFVRTGAAMLKISIVTFSAVFAVWKDLPNIARMADSELGPTLASVGAVLVHATKAALIAIVVIAVADFLYQRWQHARDLRMSKQDIKDEAKSTDGDPHNKALIRNAQREMSRRRMMSDVPKATVVITNPTHYAVALRYERSKDEALGRAPVVVAKGVDDVAQRIKKVATDAHVPLVENVPLARALHAQVEIGDEIPAALFQAVAGVLAYVYRLEGERPTAKATASAANES